MACKTFTAYDHDGEPVEAELRVAYSHGNVTRYDAFIAGTDIMVRGGHTEVRCCCGARLVAPTGRDVSCDRCGHEYNSSGQPLQSGWRRHVYEETGELVADPGSDR